jgi:hypothetical protein
MKATCLAMILDQLLAAARQCAPGAGTAQLLLRVRMSDGRRVEVKLPLPEDRPDPPAAPPTRPATLRERVVELLANETHALKGVVIAARLHHEYTSHLRQTLADMVKDGTLVRPPTGGYALSPDD